MTFLSVKNHLAALALLFVTTAHAAMWQDQFLTTPAQVDEFGFDLARHLDGRSFLAHFENNDAGTPNLHLSRKPGPNSPWTHEAIRNTGLFDVMSLDLSVDVEGGLHLAFITKGFLLGTIVNLNYGYQAPDGDWIFEVVGEADPEVDNKPGYAISLDLDSAGLPGIAYAADDVELGFVRQSADGSWTNTLVNNSNESGYRPTLKFLSNPAEPIGIVHRVLNDGGLTFTSFQTATGTWTADTIGVNSRTSNGLVEVAGGKPAIAFLKSGSTESIHYAVRENGSWTEQLVDDAFPREQDDIFFSRQFSLTVDAQARPQITYLKGFLFDDITEAQEIRHARQLPNGLWGNEVCVTLPERSGRNLFDYHLAADGDALGNTLAVYTDIPREGNLSLRFTQANGSTWTATNLAADSPGEDIISAPSIAFGPDGTRVVSAGVERGDFSYLSHWITTPDEEEFTHSAFVESNLLATETVLGDEGRIDSVVSYPSGRFVNFSTQIQDGATLVSNETDLLFSNHKLLDLTIDHQGERHLILEGDAGLEYFKAAPPLPFEAPVWESRTGQTPLTTGFSPGLAVSPSGSLSFTWAKIEQATGRKFVHTTYKKNNGQWESFAHTSDPSPTTPTTAWLDGVPRFISSSYHADDNRSTITIRTLIPEERIHFNVDGTISKIEAEVYEGTLHLAWRSNYIFQGPGEPTHSGSRYLGYLAIGACPSNPQVVGALPYLDPQDGFARIDDVDIAISPQGRPAIVANLRSDEGPDSLFLFEPAGDTASSLLDELAYPDGLRQQLVFTAEGDAVHEISFLHPSGEEATILPGRGFLDLGHLTLHSHYSEDLENETPAPEVIHLSTVADPGNPELERSTYQFHASDMAHAPRLFYRLILQGSCAVIDR